MEHGELSVTKAGRLGREFAEAAFRLGIPQLSIRWKCVGWGLACPQADEISTEAASEATLRGMDRIFHDFEHYQAWLTRVASNLAVDALRGLRRKRILDQCPSLANLDAAPIDSHLPLLHAAVAELAESEQRLLRLAFEEQLTLDAIAVALGIDGATDNAKRLKVKRLRDKIFQKLREKIGSLTVDS